MLVPKLRFKEFNDEWILKKLGRLVDIKRGASPRPINKYITSNDNGVNWIKIGDVSTDDMYINSTKEKITIEGAKKSRAVHKGDLILSNSMSFGRPYILNIDGYIHDGWLLISNYSSYFYINFLVELLSSQYMKSQYIKLSAGSTVLNLNSDLVASTLVPVPSLEEQTKIADFLSLIDRKIKLQEKLVENLNLYKKGLLKKVFSNNHGWKSAKLGDLGNFISGIGFKEKLQGIPNGDIPFFKVSDMNLAENNIFMMKSNNYISLETCFIMKYKPISNPSIIFAKVGQAIFLERKRIVNNNFLIDNNMMAFIPNDNIVLKYLYYQLTNIKFSNYCQTGALPSYNAFDLKNIKLFIPSIEEQNRIANLFTSLDKKIELETKKLQDLKTYKKGLLQKMFI